MPYDRSSPYPARVAGKHWLTSPASTRPTLHLALSTANSGFAIEPGDTVNVFVKNDPSVVEQVMKTLSLDPSSRQALTESLSLGMPSSKLLRAMAERATDDDEAIAIEDLLDDDAALDAYLRERDLLDVLGEHPSIAFSFDELRPLLPSLQPRAYSVASSFDRHPDEIHLTIGITRWTRNDRARVGVASAALPKLEVGATIPITWQASPHFRLPPDPSTPILCIGPGTGIAPFRGFLQTRGRGPVWLFFGARNRAHDFYYRDELEALASPHRVALAFSRDEDERVYVQHRLREHKSDVRSFVEGGAHIYLCGDGTSMAPAVESALDEILGAGALGKLKSDKRYHRDVYS